jgi:uncharacterized membrane protein
MNSIRALTLLGATLSMGLITGAFALYAHTLMPGLKATDDRTFVAAFGAIDRAIINPWFMAGGFVGALVLTFAAAASTIGRAPFPWVLAALVLYAVAVVITIAVNVPLNDALKAAGAVDHLKDVAAVRASFHEGRWAAFNLVRTVVSCGAFACLAWALVLYGRDSA